MATTLVDLASLRMKTKAEMKRILAEVRSGEFAKQWIDENRAGAENFKAMREKDRDHPVEEIGIQLRRLMSWIDEKEV